jgi:hypothetical protein
MNIKNYKRACEIQAEIENLNGHLRDLNSEGFNCSERKYFSYRQNELRIAIKLNPAFMPDTLHAIYKKNVENRIFELEREFEKL